MPDDALLEQLRLRGPDLSVRAVAESGRDPVDRNLARDQVFLEAPGRLDPLDGLRRATATTSSTVSDEPSSTS
jgi:hypothetical protein